MQRGRVVSPFADFLRLLLDEGSARLSQRPVVSAADREAAGAVLAAVYADYRLDVAGPPLPFEPRTAVAAAEVVWLACWFLLDHSDPPEELQRCLALPPPLTLPSPPEGGEGRVRGATASQHLSADLVLRFLPQVHRRARGVAADVLTGLVARLLRQWPLSGVLADITEPPLTALELGGHAGLQMLYAERLTEAPRPAWVPSGKALEMAELVFAERGHHIPVAQPSL
jgi:hypothetical protein